MPATLLSKGQVLAIVDSPDLTAKLSPSEAAGVTLRIDSPCATLEAERTLAQLKDTFEQAQVDQKTAERELDRRSQGISSSAPTPSCRRSRRRMSWRRRNSATHRRS